MFIPTLLLIISFSSCLEGAQVIGKSSSNGDPFGGIENTITLAQSIDNNSNMTCSTFLIAVNQTIKTHPDWKAWIDQARHNESQFIDNCEKEGGTAGEVQSFLDHQKDLLGCPEAHSRMTIIAIVFIIAFILSIIALAIVSVLYYRK